MFSVIEVLDDNSYGAEIGFVSSESDALDLQRTKHDEEGIVSDVLKLVNLKDMYGVDIQGKAWIMVSEMYRIAEVA